MQNTANDAHLQPMTAPRKSSHWYFRGKRPQSVVDSTDQCNASDDSFWRRIQPADATHYDPAQAEGELQMKYRTRTYYTDSQKALMRER